MASLDVDHRDNDPSNNDLSNLVGMCHSCHSRKTRRDYPHLGYASKKSPERKAHEPRSKGYAHVRTWES